MKKLFGYLSSNILMAILLFIFAVSIALATFIENDYGTDAARKLIYNARWFEILLALGVINIIAVAVRTKMYRKQKLTLFIFHLAFVIIIIGAGITRYFGQEGMMHIREGGTSRIWYTSNLNIGFIVRDKNTSISKSYPVLFSSVSKNHFRKKLELNSHKIKVSVEGFLPKAEKVIVADKDGNPMVHLITSTENRREEMIITEGQHLKTDRFIMTFSHGYSAPADSGTLVLFIEGEYLYFIAPFPVFVFSMENQVGEILNASEKHALVPGVIYTILGIPFVVKSFETKGTIDAQAVAMDTENASAAIKMLVTCDNISKPVTVFGSGDRRGEFSTTMINGVGISANYGVIEKKLPFELKLTDFILQRYPGSSSPSWYESKLRLIDEKKANNFEYRVYMNHVLKYRGYRFYQSSYDADEKGTILSINKDGAGIFVSYFGYLLMALGMILSLFNRNSRFVSLSMSKSGSLKVVSFIVTFLCLAGLSGSEAHAAPGIKETPIIDKEHASEFGQLLVQDNGGRIEPINTLASEVLRKVSRKEQYKSQTPDQVILGMIVYPELWQKEPMIRVNHPELQKLLGIDTKYAAYIDFFKDDIQRSYRLKSVVESAYRKKPVYRSKLDNEMIRVDERLNVCYLVYSGMVFKIFPAANDSANTWYSPTTNIGVFSQEDSIFVNQVLPYFSEEIRKSMISGEWKTPIELLKAIKTFQKHYGINVIPSDAHQKAEVFYNKSDLFNRITRIYLFIGLLLLFVQFIEIFLPRFKFSWIYIPLLIIILLIFIAHTFGIGMRWYVSGHAPLSNGYEALIFVSWAAVFAGMLFWRKAAIALSSAAILAALILQISHLSWMDPQITNLAPVLKSYWLIFHVVVIIVSYAFLGLGALVAVINLLLMILQNKSNFIRLDNQIIQLSMVIEMSLIAGLYLLAVGTFLGAVWANESWGRYWGWDPKETWALITIIVYAFILHLRLLPVLKGRVLFNIMSLIGFSSVLMTYFGVNYYLSGLHSYAQGDSIAIPTVSYYALIIVFILSLGAAFNQFRMKNILDQTIEDWKHSDGKVCSQTDDSNIVGLKIE